MVVEAGAAQPGAAAAGWRGGWWARWVARGVGGEAPRNLAAFWLMGLLNNAAYVVMIAGANEIHAGAVGLVYLCAILPALAVKLSAPYWFHLTSYASRMRAVGALMAAAYCLVAWGASARAQLAGVALSSLQGGLGEASALALTAAYDSRRTITAWSSGTGFAGVAGYSWVALLHLAAGLSFRTVLLAANASVAAWLAVYHGLLLPPPARRKRKTDDGSPTVVPAAGAGAAGLPAAPPATQQSAAPLAVASSVIRSADVSAARPSATSSTTPADEEAAGEERLRLLAPSEHPLGPGSQQPAAAGHTPPGSIAWRVRWRRSLALWPYMVPLVTVYFAEYAMQSGVWTAIGFPVTDAAARARFYTAANWCYQAGVFLSRSSGMLFQAGRRLLWAMPLMQVGLLGFFALVAAAHVAYSWWLLLPAFTTGLLGGAVYVNAFTLLSKEVEPAWREFSLGATSVADSAGIALADLAGIALQGCLFRINRLPGADFAC